MKRIDLTGKRYGRLVGIKDVGVNYNSSRVWSFQCDCGNIKDIAGSLVKLGEVRSCGCLHDEIRIAIKTTHGMSKTYEYTIWKGIKSRCADKSHPRYGGRGITVCDRWKNSFENFLEDMGVAPDGLSVDRINNDGNYEPENCRWATIEQQSNNKGNSRIIEYNGERMTMSQWAAKIGLAYSTLRGRLDCSGWSIEQALNTPRLENGHNNKKKTHCKRGHPFSGDNLAIDHRGHRYCKTCKRASGVNRNFKERNDDA